MQTKRESLIEAGLITVGNILLTMAIFAVAPWFGISISLAESFGLTIALTLKAVLVGYVVRRHFNHKAVEAGSYCPNSIKGFCEVPLPDTAPVTSLRQKKYARGYVSH